MESGINLTIYKNGESEGKDITQLVQEIRWGGKKGSPTRTLQVKLIDDDGYKHERSGIDIEDGYQGIFKYNGEELWRGIFMNQSQSQAKTGTYKAYDNAIYLSRNKDTFCYEAKKAHDVFSDVCSRFGIPTGTIDECEYEIPDLTKAKTTGWDAIEDALSLEYDNTNTRYYVFSDKGVVSLKRRKDNMLQWVLETGVNVSKYTYTKSIENVFTRIKLLSKEGTVIADAVDEALETKIGMMQDVDEPDESLNSGQLTELATSLLNKRRVPTRTLKLNDVLGLEDVISGLGVYIMIPHLGLGRSFYVDSDDHIFKGNQHTMNLTLLATDDLPDNITVNVYESTESGTGGAGGYVTFHGGPQYARQFSDAAMEGVRSGGKAKIANYAPGTAHPYYLIGGRFNDLGGDCNVYGWVDAGSFS